jgi:hypothetical protein
MPAAIDHVVELVFGRWRSQILYAGTALGVFDRVAPDRATDASAIAAQISADPAMLYRLLRALASIGLLAEDSSRAFRLTEEGSFLSTDHPQSLRAMALLEEGPEHYAVWKHLVAIVRDGRQDGFKREYGVGAFDFARSNPLYGGVFDAAMTSYSFIETEWALSALAGDDLSQVGTLCDVGGGHGHLACGFLRAYPRLTASVLDLPEVVAKTDQLWARKLGLSDRCRYIGGDMFSAVPAADAYVMKAILHDWNDTECVQVLRNMRQAVTGPGRLYVVEFIVPGPEIPHFAKLFDIHMMCALTGRERTSAEYAELLAAGGWRYAGTRFPPQGLRGVVVGEAV